MKQRTWLALIAALATAATLWLPDLALAVVRMRSNIYGSGMRTGPTGYIYAGRRFTRMKRIRTCGILPLTVCRRYQLPVARPLLPRVSTDRKPDKVINLRPRKKEKI